MTVWRAKINSQREDPPVDWDGAKEYCRRAGLVGVGWGRPDALSTGATLDEVVAAMEEIENWSQAGPRAVRALANDVADGDLVWTRDSSGAYWLGRIEGPWRYDGSDEANQWDLNNVRDCVWLEESLRDYRVPGGVVRNFAGPGATLRRVKAGPASRMSELIWVAATEPTAELKPAEPEEMLTDLLDHIDVEDVVLLYLQSKGWLLLPSSRTNSTPRYEAALRKREDGSLAVVSVKSGEGNRLPVAEVVEAADGATAFVFSTHGSYSEDPASAGAIEITRPELIEFISERPDLLTPRIGRWLDPSAPID